MQDYLFQVRNLKEFHKERIIYEVLKVKVPSNYTTREEDLARGGQGVASYSRTIERDAHNAKEAYPSYSVASTNILRFTTDVTGPIRRGTRGNSIGDTVAGTGIDIYQCGTGGGGMPNLESTNGPLPYIKLIQTVDRHTITSGPTNSTNLLIRVARIIKGNVIEIDDVESISVTGTTNKRTITIDFNDNPDVSIIPFTTQKRYYRRNRNRLLANNKTWGTGRL